MIIRTLIFETQFPFLVITHDILGRIIGRRLNDIATVLQCITQLVNIQVIILSLLAPFHIQSKLTQLTQEISRGQIGKVHVILLKLLY